VQRGQRKKGGERRKEKGEESDILNLFSSVIE